MKKDEIAIGGVYVRTTEPCIEVIPRSVKRNKVGIEYVQCTHYDLPAEIRLDRFQEKYMLKSEYILKNFERKLNIVNWAGDKGLIKPENKYVQLAKVMEELGELAKAIIKSDHEEIQDGIGDVRISLSILSEQLGFDVDHCEEMAWNVIKDRKGKMVDGSFIKNEDL